LPHVFTLILTVSVGTVIFCGTICSLHLRAGTFPLGSMEPFVARTFLFRLRRQRQTELLFYFAKVQNLKTSAK
ncbi:MAG TPA: hypothetical protein PLL90_04865, partial [Bacteroidales bacterium]|nr:hypothetical protein [Bacteroidales bacterium]